MRIAFEKELLKFQPDLARRAGRTPDHPAVIYYDAVLTYAELLEQVLDVAGGTGDIALRILARIDHHPGTRVLVCDLTDGMLAVGRDRAIDQGVLAGIDWLCADRNPDRKTDPPVELLRRSAGARARLQCI